MLYIQGYIVKIRYVVKIMVLYLYVNIYLFITVHDSWTMTHGHRPTTGYLDIYILELT